MPDKRNPFYFSIALEHVHPALAEQLPVLEAIAAQDNMAALSDPVRFTTAQGRFRLEVLVRVESSSYNAAEVQLAELVTEHCAEDTSLFGSYNEPAHRVEISVVTATDQVPHVAAALREASVRMDMTPLEGPFDGKCRFNAVLEVLAHTPASARRMVTTAAHSVESAPEVVLTIRELHGHPAGPERSSRSALDRPRFVFNTIYTRRSSTRSWQSAYVHAGIRTPAGR